MVARRFSGPLEAAPFPAQLTGRVVTAGDEPRVHGYDVESDLARHYGVADLVLLSLTGELPNPPARAAFEVVWSFLAPVSVAHSATHGALLARLCGATTAATIGATAIGLAEQARVLLAEHDELLQCLSSETTLPERYRSREPDARAANDRLCRALAGTGLCLPTLQQNPTRDAALLSVLYACGLRGSDQLQAVVVLARLPSALAEGFAESVANFASYPAHLPDFVYQESP